MVTVSSLLQKRIYRVTMLQVRLVYKDEEENIPNFDDIFRDDEDEVSNTTLNIPNSQFLAASQLSDL